ncbi:MAG: hypothetical protein EOO98_12515 [Pedobacter sp.]|nr:MAG: hypothetical protein EOO98_12515 [Pedobacter sp.]
MIELLVQAYKPSQIFQFAKLRHKNKLQSVFAQQHQQNQWTYYLFIVSNSRAQDIQDYVDEHYTVAKVIVLVEAQENLLKGQHNCNGYYSSIIHHGKLCYSNEDTACYAVVRHPNLKKFLGRAISHWQNRLKMANGFLEAGEQALEANHEQVCLFLLYQVSEQLCKGLIYVFMGYQEQMGNLKRLLHIAACFSSLPLQHFMGTPDNEILLDIMCKSITLNNCKAEVLSANKSIYRFLELVESFLKLADRLCVAEFAILQSDVELSRNVLANDKPRDLRCSAQQIEIEEGATTND